VTLVGSAVWQSAIGATLTIALAPPLKGLVVQDVNAFATIGGGICIGIMLGFSVSDRRRRAYRALPLSTAARVVAMATVEELCWRLAVLGGLWQYSPPLALLTSIVGFAMLHVRFGNLRDMAFFSFIGSAFAGAELFGGIGAAIGCHVAYNLIVGASIAASLRTANAAAPR